MVRRHRCAVVGVVVVIVVTAMIAACGLEIRGGTDSQSTPSADGGTVDPTLDGSVGPNADGALSPDGMPVGAPVIPSHLPDGGAFDPSAPDVSGLVSIDTSAPSVTYATGSGPMLQFETTPTLAILRMGRWTINGPVRVRGSRRLIVLAAREVDIQGVIDVGAHRGEAGAGGATRATGAGKGTSGVELASTESSGGGGAGAATAGARGGNTTTAASGIGGAGGASFGGALADFAGGSGGGDGAPYPACGEGGGGGAGGGALQITSSIKIGIAMGGGINAGGGGGRGGCVYNTDYAMAGGGGGAGGTIFLEAPIIQVQGALAANGGGGGGGAFGTSMVAGQPGADGRLATATADGGAGADPARNGGAGGATTVLPANGSDGASNAGGGGGSVGFVWLRTRGAQQLFLLPTAVISPTAKTDTSL